MEQLSKKYRLPFVILVWILSRVLIAYIAMISLGTLHSIAPGIPPLSYIICIDLVVVIALMTRFLRKLVESVR